MKNLTKFGVGILFTVGMSLNANACRSKMDCELGNQCVIVTLNDYGICFGGRNPGNSNDERPIKIQGDLDGTFGDTCEFNADCGPRSFCEKRFSVGLEGVCLPKGFDIKQYK